MAVTLRQFIEFAGAIYIKVVEGRPIPTATEM